MVADNVKKQVSNIDLLKAILNENTDKGEYTKITFWKVTQKLAKWLGESVKIGYSLRWDPQKRELHHQRITSFN